MIRIVLSRSIKDAALVVLALLFLALLPACNTVAGFGKDIQAIAGGGQEVVNDVSGNNPQRTETY